ncbi:MAG: MEKHLA domain-containing protein, partial [Pseudomonadota bacterium]
APDLAEDRAGHRLYHAPFAVVSHGTGKDPIFNYANLTAQELFAMPWAEITSMPSRNSAEPVNLEERNRLLGEVAAKGFIAHYEGIRISKYGRRFLIRNAVVWNVIDESEEYWGQAACFANWRYL